MVPQSLSSVASPSSAPDRGHPTTYIICELDQALPPAAQEQMAAAADHDQRLPSSHQPMSSMPEQLAAVLGQVADTSVRLTEHGIGYAPLRPAAARPVASANTRAEGQQAARATESVNEG
jgi:hypothetical protein